MATVVNTTPSSGESSSMGLFIGIAIAILAVLLFVFFAGPGMMRNVPTAPAVPEVAPPANTDGGTNINVPDTIDVNLNQEKQQ